LNPCQWREPEFQAGIQRLDLTFKSMEGIKFDRPLIIEMQGTLANDDIRKTYMQTPLPPPSPVLFQLLGMMVQASKEITAVKDILTGDTGGKVQTATTTLATAAHAAASCSPP